MADKYFVQWNVSAYAKTKMHAVDPVHPRHTICGRLYPRSATVLPRKAEVDKAKACCRCFT